MLPENAQLSGGNKQHVTYPALMSDDLIHNLMELNS